jgi:hypothetical protein
MCRRPLVRHCLPRWGGAPRPRTGEVAEWIPRALGPPGVDDVETAIGDVTARPRSSPRASAMPPSCSRRRPSPWTRVGPKRCVKIMTRNGARAATATCKRRDGDGEANVRDVRCDLARLHQRLRRQDEHHRQVRLLLHARQGRVGQLRDCQRRWGQGGRRVEATGRPGSRSAPQADSDGLRSSCRARAEEPGRERRGMCDSNNDLVGFDRE